MKLAIVIIITLITNNCFSQNYTPAAHRVIEALYAESELKKTIELHLDVYKEKVPKHLKPAFNIIIPLTDVLIKRRIELTWEFK